MKEIYLLIADINLQKLIVSLLEANNVLAIPVNSKMMKSKKNTQFREGVIITNYEGLKNQEKFLALFKRVIVLLSYGESFLRTKYCSSLQIEYYTKELTLKTVEELLSNNK